MASSTIATAADYADAMLIARRARNTLFTLLLGMLLIQLAVFFAARYTSYVPAEGRPLTMPAVATTQPAAATQPATQQAASGGFGREMLGLVLPYVMRIINFLSMGVAILLAAVLLLIVGIMLVGRLIGVASVTSAFLWCIVLALLLFPWQAFMNFPDMAGATFRLPGVLYTWSELVQDARFSYDSLPDNILKWARFVGFPVVSLLILLAIQIKSNRGLRLALGEVDLDTPVATSRF